jgi:hypothetical protein
VNSTKPVRRGFAVAPAAAGALVAALTGAAPASADPPYAKPDLDLTECVVFDDPVDYGDGIDWWKLRYTYTNEGLVDTNRTFVVRTQWVWKAGVGNEVTDNSLQVGGLARGQSVTNEFWVTATVARVLAWSVHLDTGQSVSEFEEADNFCNAWANDT